MQRARAISPRDAPYSVRPWPNQQKRRRRKILSINNPCPEPRSFSLSLSLSPLSRTFIMSTKHSAALGKTSLPFLRRVASPPLHLIAPESTGARKYRNVLRRLLACALMLWARRPSVRLSGSNVGGLWSCKKAEIATWPDSSASWLPAFRSRPGS